MFGRRRNSNQARICVVGFSANRVWLDSRFFIFLLFITKRERSQYQRLTPFDFELSWPNGLRRWSLNMEMREPGSIPRLGFGFFVFVFYFISFYFQFFIFIIFFIHFHFSLHSAFHYECGMQ